MMNLSSHEIGFRVCALFKGDKMFVSSPVKIGVFIQVFIHDGVGQDEILIEGIGDERPWMVAVGSNVTAHFVINTRCFLENSEALAVIGKCTIGGMGVAPVWGKYTVGFAFSDYGSIKMDAHHVEHAIFVPVTMFYQIGPIGNDEVVFWGKDQLVNRKPLWIHIAEDGDTDSFGYVEVSIDEGHPEDLRAVGIFPIEACDDKAVGCSIDAEKGSVIECHRINPLTFRCCLADE